MHLSSITLRGFKSFPDRTKLTFAPGVAVIVGPNGSGKSNITDAVLWALGEQSPLAVRGQSMQDVIFAGGHGVQARSEAEVEVVLDNAGGVVDLPVGEISIVRRLNRAGEGEYRINGAKCRLTDVIEILSDTGLGKEMHSVVSQGRVEAIVTSKPKDRRLLIEEAAGLGKHRKRRRRAQLKLERTQDNLDRALDVEREARTRLRPLKRQAEAAELHERIERQVDEARWALARDGARIARATLASAEEAVAAARAAAAQAESEFAAIGKRREAAEEALSARSSQREALSSRFYSARSSSEKVTMRLESANRAISDLSDRIARRGGAIAVLVEEAATDTGDDGTAARIEALQAELTELAQDHRVRLEHELTELETRREAATQTLTERTAEAQAAHAKRTEAEAAAEATRKARRALDTAAEAARRESARIGAELAKVNQFLRAHAGAPGGASSLSDTLTAAPGFELALSAALGPRLRAAVARDLPAGTALLTRAGKDGAAALIVPEPPTTAAPPNGGASLAPANGTPTANGDASLAPANGTPAANGDASLTPANGTAPANGGASLTPADDTPPANGGASLTPADGAPPAAAPAREGAAPPTASAPPAADSSPATSGGAPLAPNGGTPPTAARDDDSLSGPSATEAAMPLPRIRAFPGSTAFPVRDEAPAAPAPRPASPAPTAIPLAQHVRAGGDDASRRLAAALLHDVWVVEDVEHLAPGFTGIAVTQDGRFWSPATRELRQVAPGGDDRVLKERNHREQLIKQVEVAAQQERRALQAVEQQQATVAEADARREEIDREARVAARARDEAAEAERHARYIIEQRKAAPDEGPSAERKAQVEAAIATERKLAERAQRERDERTRRIALEQRTLERDEQLLPVAERFARALEGLQQILATRVEALEAELNADRAAGEKLAAELRECAAEESRVHQRLRERGEAVTRGEVQAQRARDHAQDAEEELTRLATKLGLEPEPSDDPLPDGEQQTLTARIERLQRRREQLGPVNPLAQAEYKEALEHVNELEAQRNDLETALRELQSLIKDTDRRIKEAFEETFAAAAKNFEEVVEHLFPGGRGALRLVKDDSGPRPVLGGAEQEQTDEPDDEEDDAPEDNMGVEIEITPAGKSTKRLTLLSGGEKSMTALAFLFAVFLARPCPFYILDEVEAALDDLNIDRFLKVLRSFSGRAQFIVVTHQKRTMEAADSLYGVSMAGNGVSKVISRRLAQEQPEAA